MNASEPRVRRRGFFLHSSDGETEVGEHENPEGFAVRTRIARSPAPRQLASGGRHVRAAEAARADEGRPQIRSGSVTGSRQRAHLPR
jgi:hypothetical protein